MEKRKSILLGSMLPVVYISFGIADGSHLFMLFLKTPGTAGQVTCYEWWRPFRLRFCTTIGG